MKKALSLILVLVLCLGLCACGGNTKDDFKQAITEYEREKAEQEKRKQLFDDLEKAQDAWDEAYDRYLNGG